MCVCVAGARTPTSNLINGDINLSTSQPPSPQRLIKTGKKYDVTNKSVCQSGTLLERKGNTGEDKWRGEEKRRREVEREVERTRMGRCV